METKACTSCAKSRRKCGQQRPHCLRCRSRGISCHYRPSKPTSFVPLVEITAVTTELEPWPVNPDLTLPAALRISITDQQVATWWFASSETWTIDRPSTELVATQTTMFSSADLKRILETTLRWLAEWVDQGSCPFIHRQLYRHSFPRCIQDAYMALSAYTNKTAANEPMVFRIIEEQVTRLVTQGLGSTNGSANDTLEYLARTQALLVYQCIGLYDGNVRLRHLAERHIPVLEDWMKHLMQHISQTFSSGAISHMAGPECATTTDALWHSYILAETTRRTYLITSGVQGIYKYILSGGTASCSMGAPIFTSRKGFWEAPTAATWEKLCTETYACLVRLTEVEKMFTMVPKDEICDFAKLALECTFGLEKCERWGI